MAPRSINVGLGVASAGMEPNTTSARDSRDRKAFPVVAQRRARVARAAFRRVARHAVWTAIDVLTFHGDARLLAFVLAILPAFTFGAMHDFAAPSSGW